MSNGGERPSSKDSRGEVRSQGGEEHRRSPSVKRAARIKRRIPCEVVDQNKRVMGFVLDLSRTGMFVQTPKPIDPGSEIVVAFKPPKHGQPIEVRAYVVRRRRLPRQVASVTSAGVGLRIETAPPEYYDLLDSLVNHDDNPATSGGGAAASKEPGKPKPRKRRLPPRMPMPETSYRMEAKQTAGSGSRSLVVSATSREHAEWLALEELGSDWKIVDAPPKTG